MIKLRPGQDKVAQYRGGYMAVPAVPGAGKTMALAYLASSIIEEGLQRPGKILIVTVMNSAVANFRSRIDSFLEERGLPRGKGYDVKTIHSLALNILKDKLGFLMINEGFQVVDEYRQTEILDRIIEEWQGENKFWMSPFKVDKSDFRYSSALKKWRDKDLRNFLKEAVKYLKLQGYSPSKLRDLKNKLSNESYLKWAIEVYEVYYEEMNRRGFLDFDDLIVHALRLLKEDAGVLDRMRRRWTYIFEDEAQDSNPLQEEILYLLSGEKGNLVRVGDSNQAIMGTFTSAEPEIFRRYCARKDVKKESILCASRSTEDIINLANHLVNWIRNYHPQKECRTALEDQLIAPVGEDDPSPNPKTEGYTIAVREFDDIKKEVEAVCKYAARHARKKPENKLAILVPNRYVQEDVVKNLKSLGANFEEVGKALGSESRTAYDLKTVVEYLARPHDTGRLIKVLREVLMPDISEEDFKIVKRLFKDYNIEEILYPVGGELPWLSLPEELFDPGLWAGFNSSVKRLRKWLEASVAISPDELILYLAEDMDLEGEQLAVAQNVSMHIREELFINPDWKLLDVADELPRMEPSFRYFVKILTDRKGYEPTPGVISVATCYKAKGLEWDTVFLMSVTVSSTLRYSATNSAATRGICSTTGKIPSPC